MLSGRRALVLAIVLAAATTCAWKGNRLLNPPGLPTEIEFGRQYAIACRDDQCVLDLDFSDSKRYLLIVGSLASDAGRYSVSLDSMPVERVQFLPAVPLLPPRSRQFIEKVPNPRPRPRQATATGERPSTERSKDGPREFYLHVTDGSPDDPKQYTRLTANLVAEGPSVRVFLDSQQRPSELAPNLPDEIVRLFEERVLPRCAETVGVCRDIDRDGKFTVLLSPWLQRMQGGRTSLGGFTREADFRPDLPTPFSNHRDMIYLNSSAKCDPHLLTLLVHEFTHAVAFSVRSSDGAHRALPAEDDWLNEAIAHVSENLNGSDWTNLDYRISRFLSAPNEYPLVVENYYQSGMWRNHGCRGATYLFLRWCADQYGERLPYKLIRSPVHGARSLEWATGERFEELFRRWTVALYQSGRFADSLRADRPTGDTNRPAREPKAERDRYSPGSSTGHTKFAGGYRSVDLFGPLSGWGLAGPRTISWTVDSPGEVLALHGTSAAFVELSADDRQAGHRRIVVRGDYDTRLQVTLVPIPSHQPKLYADAAWVEQLGGSDRQPHDGIERTRTLTVRVSSNNANSAIELIACERNYGETKETYCFSGESLNLLRRRTHTNSTDADGVAFQIPVPCHRPIGSDARPIIVKVISRGTEGRRATAWAQIDEAPESPSRVLAGLPRSAGRHAK